MSVYIIDHLTGFRQFEYGSSNNFNLHIRIDKYGNINIKKQTEYRQQNGGNTLYPWHEELTINDNIPFPSYFENILKTIINKGGSYYADWLYIIDLIKLFKSTIKEHINNPDYITDIETKLNITTNKNVILETQIKEIEQKVKNIETLYFDTLKDNEKLKEEIVLLKETNTNNLKSNENNVVLYNDLQLENEKLKYEMKILKFKLLNKHITV
jgi:hypothetical protein